MRAFVILLTATAVLTGSASPASAAPPGDWAQAGADAGWSEYQPATRGLSAARAAGLDVAWSRDLAGENGENGSAPATAVLAGGTLCIGTGAGTIEALDPATGRSRGRVRLGGPRQIEQLAAANGLLIVRSTGGFNR